MKKFKLEELKREHYLKMILFGASGSGKTFATFNTGIKTLGLMTQPSQSAATFNFMDREHHPDSEFVHIEESGDVLKALEEYKAEQFPLVVLDHASDIMDMILKELPLYCFQKEGQKDKDILAQSGYVPWKKRFKDLIRKVLALRTNVLILGHEDVSQNDMMQRFLEIKGPGRGSGDDIMRDANAVGWLKVDGKTGKRSIKFRPAANLKVKRPSPFDALEKDADMKRLLKKFHTKKENK